jgi:hypothetical protein
MLILSLETNIGLFKIISSDYIKKYLQNLILWKYPSKTIQARSYMITFTFIYFLKKLGYKMVLHINSFAF